MATNPPQLTAQGSRRTQLNRSESTQRRIIDSALRLLHNEGPQGAGLQEIARGADVTMGALQHHFRSRQALIERLIEEVMAPLSDQGAVWPSPGLPLDNRASEFVRLAWEKIYGADLFRNH